MIRFVGFFGGAEIPRVSPRPVERPVVAVGPFDYDRDSIRTFHCTGVGPTHSPRPTPNCLIRVPWAQTWLKYEQPQSVRDGALLKSG